MGISMVGISPMCGRSSIQRQKIFFLKPIVHATVMRSLQKPTKAGFAAMVRKSLTQVDRITPGGLYIDTVGGMKVNRRRIIRVSNRIIRGLFFHEYGYRIPEGYEVINQDF